MAHDVVIRTAAVDAAVIKTVGEVLDSRVIEKSIELAGRLVQALVNSGPMETVVAQIKVEEECKRTLTAEYDSLDGASAPEAFDYASIVRELRERTADVQAVLSRQTTQARQMQPKLLDGKIDVEPGTLDGRRGSRLSGRLNVGRLRRTEVLRAIEATTSDEANGPTVVAPTGFEPVFQP